MLGITNLLLFKEDEIKGPSLSSFTVGHMMVVQLKDSLKLKWNWSEGK
jgi:hypothetical protein